MIIKLTQQEIVHVGGGCVGGDVVVSERFDRRINMFTAIGIFVGVALIANGIVGIVNGVDAVSSSLQSKQNANTTQSYQNTNTTKV